MTKEENPKKERPEKKEIKPKPAEKYQNFKLKRSGLQKARDVVAIVRDIFIILTVVGLIIGGLFIVNLYQSGKFDNIINSLNSLVGVGSILAPSGGGSSGTSGSTSSTGPNAEICNLISEIRGDALAGDFLKAASKIGEAETLTKKKGLTETANDINKITSTALSGELSKLVSLISKINKDLGC